MNKIENQKNNLKERLLEQEEERINNEFYSGIINQDDKLFVNRLARKYNNHFSIVHVLNRLKKSKPDLHNDIIQWFKFPLHINTICNIYIILEKYYEVEDEHKIGLMSWLFEKYDQSAWELWYDRYKEKGYVSKYNDKQVKSMLKKHGFIPMHKIKFDMNTNWLYNTKFKLIYPKSFDAHINSLDTKNMGIYLAGKLYGVPGHTGTYIAPAGDTWLTETSKSTCKFLKSNTIK